MSEQTSQESIAKKSKKYYGEFVKGDCGKGARFTFQRIEGATES